MNNSSQPSTGAEQVAWDLSDLYAAASDPAIDHDLDAADAGAARLSQTYRGHVATLDPRGLSELLLAYEAIREGAEKAGNYAFLLWSSDTSQPAHGALLQRTTERGSRLAQQLIFLDLELAAAPDETASTWLAASEIARYCHWLEVVRLYRPYLLTEPEEKIIAEKSVTGRTAWSRFFDETQGAARYALDGEELTRDQALNKLYSPDRDLRRRAAESVTTGL